MTAAIQLDDQLCTETIKINDKFIYTFLSLKTDRVFL